MSIQVIPLNAYKDNYIWTILNDDNEAVIVDPGEAEPFMKFIERNNHIKLSGILITHKHYDHCNGVPDILKKYSVPVYGPSTSEVSFINHTVKEGDVVNIERFPKLKVIEIPGHTLEHVAYYNDNMVFCGDTLFTGGCGRIFEGTPPQMYQTLMKITSLNDDVLVYCGHEYTLANLKFAKVVDPNNKDLSFRYEECEKLRNDNQPTVPATLRIEKLTNPFLRCHTKEITESVKNQYQKNFNDVVEIFEHLR
jgi:hydroxyacylglutathione hydrolase